MDPVRPSRKDFLSSCDDVGPEDGIDPRDWRRLDGRRVKNHKALQLCAQVAKTLSAVLAGECGDDVLRELAVESVVPASNSSQLLVTLSSRIDSGTALQHLRRAEGRLRTEVAAAIHRRRTPRLSFCVVPHRNDRITGHARP